MSIALKTFSVESDLLSYVNSEEFDGIVVEGYDGVGKGKILTSLSKNYKVTPYRPDYNFWQNFDLRKTDRWKISAFFWDVFNHFQLDRPNHPLLFDRGILSGAVYNCDEEIAQAYKSVLRGRRVLHILVICDHDSYKNFQLIRNPTLEDGDINYMYNECLDYTQSYMHNLDISGVEWVIYKNIYSAEDAETYKKTCSGCGHYNGGVCRNPRFNCPVPADQPRCEYSAEREVQDYDTEMHSL